MFAHMMLTMPRLVAAGLLCLGAEAHAQAADSVDRLMHARMQRDHIPGATVAIVRHGKVVKLASYGVASIELGSPATAETVYELASLSKPIVATCVMMLVEQGRISLSDSLPKYFPDAPPSWASITVRHLLTHEAGFPNYYYSPQRLSAVSALRYTVAQQLADVERLPLRFAPGTQVDYSTTGYFLLSQIVARASGTTYREFVHRNVIEPLGMTHTRSMNVDALIPHRADGYTVRGDSLAPWRLAVELQAVDDEYTLLSTAGDLVLFAEGLRTGKLLKPQTMSLVATPATLSDGTTAHYGADAEVGLGWFLHRNGARPYAVHAGHTGTALLRYLDGDGLTIVLLTNLGSGYPPPFGHDHGFAPTELAQQIALAVRP